MFFIIIFAPFISSITTKIEQHVWFSWGKAFVHSIPEKSRNFITLKFLWIMIELLRNLWIMRELRCKYLKNGELMIVQILTMSPGEKRCSFAQDFSVLPCQIVRSKYDFHNTFSAVLFYAVQMLWLNMIFIKFATSFCLSISFDFCEYWSCQILKLSILRLDLIWVLCS